MYTHPITTTIGIAVMITGLLFTAAPDLALSASSLGQFLPDPYEILWPMIHFLGGSLLVIGMAKERPKYEAAGLTLLFFTLSASCIGVIVIRGFESGMVASSTLGAVAIGCALRAIMLVRSGKVK